MIIKCSILPDSSDCMKRAVSKQFATLLIEAGFDFPVTTGDRIYNIVGNSAHHGSFEMLKHKIVKGELGNVNHYIDAALTEYSESVRKSENLEFDKNTHNIRSGEDQIKRLIKSYYRDIAPNMRFPDNCDYRDHLNVGLKCTFRDYELTGDIDVLTKYSVCDTRTGKRIRPYHLQLGGCANLLKINSFKKPKYLITQYLPIVPTEKPYPGTIIKQYDYDFCVNYSWHQINTLIDCTEKFKKTGNPACFSSNPESKLCSPKYCKAYNTSFCAYFKQGD